MVKPVDNMGARGVESIKDIKKIEHAIAKAGAYSPSNTVIVENKLEGPELSIDSFLINGKVHPIAIADRHIFFEPYFIETGHSIPSRLPVDLQNDACRVLQRSADALGIYNGVCKADIIFHKNKAYMGECAARLSGGYMSGWTIPYAYRLDPSYYALIMSLQNNLTSTDSKVIKNPVSTPHAACSRKSSAYARRHIRKNMYSTSS